MKITGNIEVSNRLLSSANIPSRRKSPLGCLSIARQSVKNKDLYLLLQTTQNKQGTKYKVDNNVEKVFTKFVNEGKATIRIKEPPHDLIIQCESLQLKSFLHLLKLGLSKKFDPSIISVSNLNPKNLQKLTPKTKIVVNEKSKYPVLEGFPKTCESLYLVDLERKSFDRQILRLQSLRLLDLSGNLLSSLPNELGTLPHLKELYLSSNFLGKAESSKWSWMDGPNIGKNLKLLDLSNNSIRKLPEQIKKLSSLVTLQLGRNLLTKLPQSIGSLTALKYLELRNNYLSSLPVCLRSLYLTSLDIADNPLDANGRFAIINAESLKLTAIAARVVIDSRICYDASIIPSTLVKYLDAVVFCVCGKSCFGTYICECVDSSICLLATSVSSSGRTYVPLECYFCTTKCLKRVVRH